MGAPQAQAGLLPTLLSVTPDSGSYKFFYSVEIPDLNQVRIGDSMTLYDFAGLVPGSVGVSGALGNWTVAVANVTPPPLGLNVTDDPGLANITLTYNPTPASTTINGSAGFTFWANSIYSGVYDPPDSPNPEFNVTSTVHRKGIAGIENAVTNVAVPSAETPEPATLAMVGIGLPILGAFHLYRRRRAARA
jgi:hypothetical protein